MDREYLQKFAIHLKSLRKQKGLTHDYFDGEKISRSMISLLETCQTDVTITKLKVIADILGVNVKDLFDFE